MTRSRLPRDPRELHDVFREHEGPAVDVAGLLSGVRHRIDRRRQRRRTAGIVAVGVVTALAAGLPIVVSSIPDQNAGVAGGSSQSAPTPTTSSAPPEDQPLAAEDLRSTEFAFTLAERPSDYTMEFASTGPGWQLLRLFVPDSVRPYRTLDVRLFDPALAGLAAPEPTGETVIVESASAGPLTVQVISHSQEGQSYPGVGWMTSNGLWLTVTSTGPADLARQEALAVAAQVDLGDPYPLTFPFQVGYVPEGFSLAGAATAGPAPGASSFLRFHDLSPLVVEGESALTITAVNLPGIPEDSVPNTTVGPFQAEFLEGLFLSVFDVGGFQINISVRADYGDRIGEDELRRIAESIVVIAGAATDSSVWTDQPLG